RGRHGRAGRDREPSLRDGEGRTRRRYRGPREGSLRCRAGGQAPQVRRDRALSRREVEGRALGPRDGNRRTEDRRDPRRPAARGRVRRRLPVKMPAPAELSRHVVRVTTALLLEVHGLVRPIDGGVAGFGGFLESRGFPFGSALAWAITLFEIAGAAC